MPAAIMEELFPARETMVSVIFGPTIATDAPSSATTTIPPERPQTEPPPLGTMETPAVLSVSDELREAIFPTQKVMVSAIFNLPVLKPLAPAPVRRHWAGEDLSCEHDFPII